MQSTQTMNLLISPFDPEQSPSLRESPNEPLPTQPLDVPMNQTHPLHFDMDLFSSLAYEGLSEPVDLNYPSSSLPSLDTMSRYANYNISHSPESSTSTDSNLASSPHPYTHFPGQNDFVLADMHNPSIHQLQFSRRSSSVPPHFQQLKFNSQDNSSPLYNHAQVTPSIMPPPTQQAVKPPPIQIQRFVAQYNHTHRSLDSETHRRLLDEKLEKIDFDDITVAELKEALRERGLSATGRKAELWHRLKEEYDAMVHRKSLSCQVNSSPISLPRRISNMSLHSPKKQPQTRFSPYSPPPSRRSSQIKQERPLASSLPNDHTPSFLNDQFMMMKKPSGLRQSIDNSHTLENQGNGKQTKKE
ncbi:hypothetical protein EDC96DRAFT_505367 [Choanephora cucurbitarum]|nr:hypothetical protein EDC96DRAFT_505367 [Choanephora cucurbitarum]